MTEVTRVSPVPADRGYKTGELCPNCSANLWFGRMFCPVDPAICIRTHYGYHCFGCGKDWL